ncbi:MAG: TRAP transporter large permease subunit, partial [Deltaproteobacteria bacterium]|nr:TRAP transporter large permease subunit [Deltaproteobacteria bacterium]
VAMNLQTSFLTPPFGFSLFYLKGVSPPGVKTTDIYRGVVPFIAIQVFVLAILVVYPEIFGLSSSGGGF